MVNEEQNKLKYFFDSCMTILATGIEPFVRRLVHEGRGKISSEDIDHRKLLKAINENWKCFSGTWAKSNYGFVIVLSDFANDKWAHAHKSNLFDNRDITTSIDHVKRLLDATNTTEATEAKIELEKIEKEFGDFVRSTQLQKTDTVNGAIEINENHTADNISGKKVLCPACKEFPFKIWPLGWDGHALKCGGLSKNSHSERKSEFLHRFGYLIKAHRGKYFRRP